MKKNLFLFLFFVLFVIKENKIPFVFVRKRLATSPVQDVWVELFKNTFTALYIYIRKERKWACFCLFVCFFFVLFCISLFEFSAKVPFESNWIHVQNWVKVVIIRDRRRIKFSPLLGWG